MSINHPFINICHQPSVHQHRHSYIHTYIHTDISHHKSASGFLQYGSVLTA
jgi:hypothetical protein